MIDEIRGMEERALNHNQSNFSDILFLGFNHNNEFLTVGTTNGFFIHSIKPFKIIAKELIGGISIIEMLSPNELIALVGSSSGYKTSSRCLIMWNTHTKAASTSFSFNSPIHTVKMNPRRVIVGLENSLRIYDLESLVFLRTIKHEFDYFCTPFVCCLSTSLENGYLVIPASRLTGKIELIDTYNSKIPSQADTHKSPVKLMSFNKSATMLATASIKGTIIRIWSIPDFQRLYSLRRSTIPITLFQISFSSSSRYIVSTGSSGSVYVFKLGFMDQSKNDTHTFKTITQENSISECCINNKLNCENYDQNQDSDLSLETNKSFYYDMSSYSRIYLDSIKNFCHLSFSSLLNYLPNSYKEVIATFQCISWLNLGQPCSSLPSIAIILENILDQNSKEKFEIFIACHAGCAYLYEFSPEKYEEARKYQQGNANRFLIQWLKYSLCCIQDVFRLVHSMLDLLSTETILVSLKFTK